MTDLQLFSDIHPSVFSESAYYSQQNFSGSQVIRMNNAEWRVQYCSVTTARGSMRLLKNPRNSYAFLSHA